MHQQIQKQQKPTRAHAKTCKNAGEATPDNGRALTSERQMDCGVIAET
jgi:hypothetical protein